MCSNYTSRRTASERAGGTAGCNMSSLTVAVLPRSVRLVGLAKARSLLHCPVALSLEEDGLPDSTQRKGHQTALTQWSSLCSYPPSPDILFYPLLMTKQKQNKGKHTPVPNVCLCWVLGEREEGEQMKWEGRVGREGQPSSESSGLCSGWSPLLWNVVPPPHHVMWTICCQQSQALVIVPEQKLRRWIPCVGAGARREKPSPLTKG